MRIPILRPDGSTVEPAALASAPPEGEESARHATNGAWIDEVIEEAHHRRDAGPWILGRYYYDQLRRRGLRREDKVLDVGCGSGRVGVWVAGYLGPASYCGVDSDLDGLVAFAEYEAHLHGLHRKSPRLLLSPTFAFESFGEQFDVVLDLGATQRLEKSQAIEVYQAAARVMRPEGRVFVTGEPQLTDAEMADLGFDHSFSRQMSFPLLSKSARHPHPGGEWNEFTRSERVSVIVRQEKQEEDDLASGLAASRTALRERRFDDAIASATALRDRFPDSVAAVTDYVYTLWRSGRSLDALDELRAARQRGINGNKLSEMEGKILARALRDLRRTAEAQERVDGPGAAVPLWERLIRETPPDLRQERWFDVALGSVPSFRTTLDRIRKKRIYIAGCARSGTWLATGIMDTFHGVYTAKQERHFGHFAAIAERPEPVHVVKRTVHAHEFLAMIPHDIHLLYMLRDPGDVLTSQHLDKDRAVSLERWEKEMEAFAGLLAARRPNLHVVRYEDLAARPGEVQRRLGETLALQVDIPAAAFHSRFVVDELTASIMHGLRPPDAASIGRWRRDPLHRAYIESLRLRISAIFNPLAERFGYDLTAPS